MRMIYDVCELHCITAYDTRVLVWVISAADLHNITLYCGLRFIIMVRERDGKSRCFAHWHRRSSRAEIKTLGGHVERIIEIFIIELHIRAR